MSDNFSANKAAFFDLKNAPKPKAIIFDWDNTLVDTWPLIQIAIDTTMTAMGKEPWGLEKVRDNVHKSMRESFPEIFGTDWVKAGEIYKNTYRSINLDKISLLQDAENLIKIIAQKQIIQCVVSNKIGTTLRQEAKKIESAKNFFSMIGASDADSDKPSTKPVELALLGSNLGLNNKDIWFVGDTITDIDCAINCGFTPILFGIVGKNGEETISKTMSGFDVISGNSGKALPIYFKHSELVEVISSF